MIYHLSTNEFQQLINAAISRGESLTTLATSTSVLTLIDKGEEKNTIYENLLDLYPDSFRVLVRFLNSDFLELLYIVEDALNSSEPARGRPSKHKAKDSLLITLIYFRGYQTISSLTIYLKETLGVIKGTIDRTIKAISPVLISTFVKCLRKEQ